jgi:hypothetical protein
MGKLNPITVFIFLPEQFAKDPEIALLRERAERVRRQMLLVFKIVKTER